MIYTLQGILSEKRDGFVILDVQGVGYRVFTPKSVLEKLPSAGSPLKFYCYMNVRENGTELYGFLSETERKMFELLTSVSGVGPKTAARVLDVASIEQVAGAIHAGKAELLTKASGVGRKTAERVVIELRGKMEGFADKDIAKTMESDVDIVETLAGLGYKRQEAKDALAKVDEKIVDLEERLKAALKNLTNK